MCHAKYKSIENSRINMSWDILKIQELTCLVTYWKFKIWPVMTNTKNSRFDLGDKYWKFKIWPWCQTLKIQDLNWAPNIENFWPGMQNIENSRLIRQVKDWKFKISPRVTTIEHSRCDLSWQILRIQSLSCCVKYWEFKNI